MAIFFHWILFFKTNASFSSHSTLLYTRDVQAILTLIPQHCRKNVNGVTKKLDKMLHIHTANAYRKASFCVVVVSWLKYVISKPRKMG